MPYFFEHLLNSKRTHDENKKSIRMFVKLLHLLHNFIKFFSDLMFCNLTQ